MYIQDLAGLITIRNFLNNSIDNLNIKIEREDIKSLRNKIVELDKEIIKRSLALDATANEYKSYRTYNSTVDVEEVMGAVSAVPVDVEKLTKTVNEITKTRVIVSESK